MAGTDFSTKICEKCGMQYMGDSCITCEMNGSQRSSTCGCCLLGVFSLLIIGGGVVGFLANQSDKAKKITRRNARVARQKTARKATGSSAGHPPPKKTVHNMYVVGGVMAVPSPKASNQDLANVVHKYPNLRTLYFLNSKNITDISPLAQLKKLREVSFFGCTGIKDITPLGNSKKLLKIVVPPQLTNSQLTFLATNLPQLTKLNLALTMNLTDFDSLARLKRMTDFTPPKTFRDKDLARLVETNKNLSRLNFNVVTGMTDFTPLAKLKRLRYFSFPYASNAATRAKIIPNLQRLRRLDIVGVRDDFDLTTLRGLPKLNKLVLNSWSSGTSLSGLEELQGLRALTLTNCRNLVDITTLAQCLKLDNLTITFCNEIADFSVLAKIPALRYLRFSGNEQLTQEAFERLKKLRPKVRVIGRIRQTKKK